MKEAARQESLREELVAFDCLDSRQGSQVPYIAPRSISMCARLLLQLLLTSLLIELRFAQNPTQCLLPNHTMAPCGPGNEQCGPPFLHAPQFHIRGLSCGLNDPNAPVFDQKHGIYHLFYQNHVAEPMGPNGVTWAHVVSRDLVHWARLATAFWNDQPYDKVAIYTGSATVVDGVITIMYPGLCTKELWPPCATGYNLVTAVPANASADPLLRNWTKLGVVFNNSDKDPVKANEYDSREINSCVHSVYSLENRSGRMACCDRRK